MKETSFIKYFQHRKILIYYENQSTQSEAISQYLIFWARCVFKLTSSITSVIFKVFSVFRYVLNPFFCSFQPAKPQDAAKMEEQDDMIIARLRTSIAKAARVPEMRIPYLKVIIISLYSSIIERRLSELVEIVKNLFEFFTIKRQ